MLLNVRKLLKSENFQTTIIKNLRITSLAILIILNPYHYLLNNDNVKISIV
jgi:hypothetical protein